MFSNPRDLVEALAPLWYYHEPEQFYGDGFIIIPSTADRYEEKREHRLKNVEKYRKASREWKARQRAKVEYKPQTHVSWWESINAPIARDASIDE